MQAFTVHQGRVLPMDRANVDTDAIIPKQYLKSIHRSGFGPFLFDDWRYLDPGDLSIDPASRRPNAEFELNSPVYAGASILLARRNFGCGSSREHAVWALENAGFRCVIAPSFADIFFNNCFKNGVLPIVLEEDVIQSLFEEFGAGAEMTVDLQQLSIVTPGQNLNFSVDPARRERLLEGLDDIGQTLQYRDDILAFEARRREQQPWLFGLEAEPRS